jgi:hypothetical protein
MPNGTVRCDEHWREEDGLPQLTPEARVFIDGCNELERQKDDATHTDRCGPRENAKTLVRGIESDNHRTPVSRQQQAGKKNPHKPGYSHPRARPAAHAVTVTELRQSWEEL